MAESNATQVILTDDGIKIINAQSTADIVSGEVANLNDPNLMSVIEKQTEASQYAGVTSQYNVVLAQAKEANVSTTDLTTAYTNLNTFMTAILTDTTKASDVDRDSYKALTDAYNTALSNVQTALSNSFNTDMDNMQSSVSVASQAASSAAIVASQATSTGNNASQVASQAYSAATVAQSVGNNATSIANSASQAASNAVLTGSQAAVSASQASADYQTLSAGVKDGSVVHITAETVIDKGVIGTAEIANGAITNAQIGDASIDSAKIANLAVGAAQIGDGAITNAKIGSLAVGTAQIADAAITDAKMGNISANHITTGSIDASKVTVAKLDAGNITTGTLSTDRLNVGKLSALSANLGDVTTGSLKGVDIVANSFSTPNGSFTTDSNGNVVASNLTIRGVTNLVYNASLLGNSGTYPNTEVPGWNLFTKGYYSNATLHDGVPSIGFNSSTGSGTWVTFGQSKLYPLNGLTGQSYSASVWFIEDGSESTMMYQFTLAFFDANGSRLTYSGTTWTGNPTAQGWAYKTIDNVVSPSTAVYVAIQYWAYNGTGHALFSSPMLTQTAQSTGYLPDTGNVVSAGEIDGSVINGSTINGTTFNAGTKLNQYGNTSYPLTINQDGSVTSTSFETIDTETAALRTVIKDGALKTNLRGMTQFATGMYSAADISLGAGQLALLEGYSTSQDPNFDATGLKTTGYAILDASAGLSLHGTTQAINFSGTDQSQTTGITMNSYGNIIGYSNSTWWRVTSNAGSDVANFGIDSAGSNVIQFNRELDIGNFHINTGHTFTSADNGAIHFAMGKGGAADIYAGAVHYTSLVKSSLLSVKKDVQKADTSYWAQLVNSIDLATYQYKTDDNTSQLRLSSIVDDVNDTKQWRLPDVFINRDEDGKLSGVDDSVLLNATLATVQEQQKEIDQLNGHNMQLEARLNKLEAKLNG
ncbi:phage tail protein [Lactiplantibacillus plantarum]|uniref:beta strand repeat-containing protein n=1 Tax=Lactiplantibacillus plantarum TaxID=1590 RepID=UPI001CFECE02|nr:phage tail protein [Lactiplantibacillus plantarum]WQC49577.1 phage tail protein [Lactiplantibacillus plantarum]WQG55436.1 phage tail protein [Lactiplantibacillus plantarum]GJI54456.1 phage tail protein [Lactiplantibacillus plantarum]